MAGAGRKKNTKGGKKVRVAMRRNRAKPARFKDWKRKADESEDRDIDSAASEGVAAKGDLSRRRTVIVPDDESDRSDSLQGTVIAMRGLYAEVDDGDRIWLCTVRRVLRTRRIDERQAVSVGDRVRFKLNSGADNAQKQGVIERVDPRTGCLRRRTGRKIQTIVANVDQVIIVSSAAQPTPKPNLIDRYLVAASAGDIAPIICMNKIDLDDRGTATELLDTYAGLGFTTLSASAVTGNGIAALRRMLKQKASAIVGQSGVGKSSLLNAVQPGLALATSDVGRQTQKGRHTTTTAKLIRLDIGGYVVDTPGIRSFDLSLIPREEYEAHFVEIAERVADCGFADCTHTHETTCAIKQAVERNEISAQRYDSYVQMYHDPGTVR